MTLKSNNILGEMEPLSSKIKEITLLSLNSSRAKVPQNSSRVDLFFLEAIKTGWPNSKLITI